MEWGQCGAGRASREKNWIRPTSWRVTFGFKHAARKMSLQHQGTRISTQKGEKDGKRSSLGDFQNFSRPDGKLEAENSFKNTFFSAKWRPTCYSSGCDSVIWRKIVLNILSLTFLLQKELNGLILPRWSALSFDEKSMPSGHMTGPRPAAVSYSEVTSLLTSLNKPQLPVWTRSWD